MGKVLKFGFALALLAICALGFFSMNVKETDAADFTPYCHLLGPWCGDEDPPHPPLSSNHTDLKSSCICLPDVPCWLYLNNNTGTICYGNCR